MGYFTKRLRGFVGRGINSYAEENRLLYDEAPRIHGIRNSFLFCFKIGYFTKRLPGYIGTGKKILFCLKIGYFTKRLPGYMGRPINSYLEIQ